MNQPLSQGQQTIWFMPLSVYQSLSNYLTVKHTSTSHFLNREQAVKFVQNENVTERFQLGHLFFCHLHCTDRCMVKLEAALFEYSSHA